MTIRKSMTVPTFDFSTARVVGVGGSRAPSPTTRSCVVAMVQTIPATAVLHVGEQRGVDGLALTHRGTNPYQLFDVKDYGPPGLGSSYAKRSIACVESTNVDGGWWLSFPDRPCPATITPSSNGRACFNGSGSGSWSSLAYALGLAVRDGLLQVVLYLPPPLQPPDWGFVPCDVPGWYARKGGVS